MLIPNDNIIHVPGYQEEQQQQDDLPQGNEALNDSGQTIRQLIEEENQVSETRNRIFRDVSLS